MVEYILCRRRQIRVGVPVCERFSAMAEPPEYYLSCLGCTDWIDEVERKEVVEEGLEKIDLSGIDFEPITI